MKLINILIILLVLIIIVPINAYYTSEISINSNIPEKNISFTINKISNYDNYNISFTHFGNIKNYTVVKIFINNKEIYTISKSNNNTGSGSYKKSISIDITNYLNNGDNTLKMVGNNMGAPNYTPYYKLKNIHITEPVKTPIPTIALIFSSILITIIILNKNYKISSTYIKG
ncbi:hypothetical protein [Methanococcus aeolicus]|uniref:Uncharacterized protein n=1 Tax=Methanococcus aeolicus (strain ATCC BAA-1280 / DSM 17508 / OCM 812 / Nankai-3) TaxID=419665 RepID=A6UUQ7_META3|nr:hypothetical protein [Methanococcus aeolicus]ABR56229.1 conserved hypothetical protein [Methanococcus aeolicus Nankai-3]UXM84240.1 hypothetical protein N6C89_05635 [Methanococcus aeolicus]